MAIKIHPSLKRLIIFVQAFLLDIDGIFCLLQQALIIQRTG